MNRDRGSNFVQIDMGSVYKLKRDNTEVLVFDFSDGREEEMIKILLEGRELLIREQKKRCVLGIFNQKNYITPNFMNFFRTQKREAIAYMEKQAVVGLTEPKKWILKGYNILFNRNIRTFDTAEDAINYLVSDDGNERIK